MTRDKIIPLTARETEAATALEKAIRTLPKSLWFEMDEEYITIWKHRADEPGESDCIKTFKCKTATG